MKTVTKIFTNPFFYALTYTVFHLVLVLNSQLGITPDGISYLQIGASIANNDAFYVDNQFISHWPPLYPITLAIFTLLFKVGMLTSATILSVITSFFFVLLINIFIHKYLQSWQLILLFNCVLFGSASLHVMQLGLSEPLFMIALMLTLMLVYNTSIQFNGWQLAAIGLLCGIMVMIRFAGIGVVLGVGLFVLIKSKSLLKSTIMGLVFMLTLIPWFAFTKLQNQAPMDRDTVFHLITFKHLKGLAGSFYRFVNPSEMILFGLLSTIAIGLLLWSKKAQLKSALKKAWNSDISQLLILLACSYLFFLFISISLFDYKTPLNTRMLFPFYILVLLAIFYVLKELKLSKLSLPLQLSFVVIALSHLVSTSTYASNYIKNGVGFTSKAWTNSETLAKSEDFKNKKVYSNASNVLRFYEIGKPYYLPVKEDGGSTKIRTEYTEEYDKMIQEVINNEAVIVIFENKKWWPYLPSKDEIEQSLANSGEVVTLNDGKIYY